MKKPKENQTTNGTGGHRRMPLENYAFDTMEQCEAQTGLPKATMQWAKANGCAAFRHGRVYFLDLFKWIVLQQHDGEAVNWTLLNTELDAKLKQIKIAIELHGLISKDEVQECLQRFSSVVFGAMKRMTMQSAVEMEMRPREFIKQMMDKAYSEAIERARAEIDKLMRDAEENEQHTQPGTPE